jgi:hypothetical protein
MENRIHRGSSPLGTNFNLGGHNLPLGVNFKSQFGEPGADERRGDVEVVHEVVKERTGVDLMKPFRPNFADRTKFGQV